MPNSIYNIKERPYIFHSAASLQECVDGYFNYIKGDFEMVIVPPKTPAGKKTKEKRWLREPEAATFAGLAYYLGFASLEAFEKYECNGSYKRRLKRARLRVEAEYEKRLQGANSAGAIFALKNMGWTDKSNAFPVLNGNIKIEIINTGPEPAASETEVQL